MLRDASHQQVIQKFSFIESLNLSRQKGRANQDILAQIDLDRAFNFVPQITIKAASTQTTSSSSAIVTAAQGTATIDTNSGRFNSENYNLSLAKIVKNSTFDQQKAYPRSKRSNYLGKILFALASSYCIFALWWLFGDRASSILTTLMGGKQITVSKSDLEFIDYLEQSVSAIETQVQAAKAQERDEKVMYVPVYTPHSTPPVLPQISRTNLPSANLSSNNVPTIPKPIAATESQSSSPLKIPAPPPLPAPTPLPANETAASTKVAAIKTQPEIRHTLMGILELGENRSAALIKVNGQTRRFWLGEKIGNSEWILESVTNSSAKISDRGQVRSVAVGETF